jgi:hypothetical protein
MDNLKCSKCNGELDREGTEGTAHWCKGCRAKYQREYEATRKEIVRSKGFKEGVAAMREYLARNFRQYGTQGSFTGNEICGMILTCKGPR